MGKKNTADTGFAAKEWNAGGAIHFYGSEKPRTFNVEVTTADPIRGDILQSAVDKTLERMPYYGQTFVRKKGLYYYADDDLPFPGLSPNRRGQSAELQPITICWTSRIMAG